MCPSRVEPCFRLVSLKLYRKNVPLLRPSLDEAPAALLDMGSEHSNQECMSSRSLFRGTKSTGGLSSSRVRQRDLSCYFESLSHSSCCDVLDLLGTQFSSVYTPSSDQVHFKHICSLSAESHREPLSNLTAGRILHAFQSTQWCV